jgi:hypothetical protein
MRDPKMKATLSALVDEAVGSKQKILGEQEHIKALRLAAFEELGLKPALFNDFVSMTFNNDYADRRQGLEQKLSLVELVMSDAQLSYTPAP